jgi:nucleoside-diphosphate-sugar epimerase
MYYQLSYPCPVQFVIGSGGNRSDFTYVENVAHANICAEQALCSDTDSVAGKVHFWLIKTLVCLYHLL